MDVTSRVSLKPDVYKCRDGTWAACLDHITWEDITYFDTWEAALDHALWLGLTAGVWS